MKESLKQHLLVPIIGWAPGVSIEVVWKAVVFQETAGSDSVTPWYRLRAALKHLPLHVSIYCVAKELPCCAECFGLALNHRGSSSYKLVLHVNPECPLSWSLHLVGTLCAFAFHKVEEAQMETFVFLFKGSPLNIELTSLG